SPPTALYALSLHDALPIFLTGTQDYIHALAKRFNIYVDENKEAAGGFEHSGLFALIDKEGKIRCRTDKFGNPILYYSGLNYLDRSEEHTSELQSRENLVCR